MLCKIVLMFYSITNIKAHNLFVKNRQQSKNLISSSDQCSDRTVIIKFLLGEKGTRGESGKNGTKGELGKKGETGEKGEPGHINQTLVAELLLNLTGK